MNNFKNKLLAFMSGRNGMDSFNKFLFALYLILYVLLFIISFFVHHVVSTVLSFCLTLLALYLVYRFFSRNLVKRQIENRNFLSVMESFKTSNNLRKSMIRDRKTHVYKKCPYCKAVLRLKRIKGKHRAACPRCSKSFDVNVR